MGFATDWAAQRRPRARGDVGAHPETFGGVMTRSASPDPLEPTSVNPPVVHDVSAPREEEQEKVYYEGSPLVRGNIGSLFLFFVIGAIFIAVPIAYRILEGVWLYLPISAACVIIG